MVCALAVMYSPCLSHLTANIALLDEKLELITIGDRAMENGANLFVSRGTYYLLEVHSKSLGSCTGHMTSM